MNKCIVCGRKAMVVTTETTFAVLVTPGHRCFVKCVCGNQSTISDDCYGEGLFSEKAFRSAEYNWNDENLEV